MLTIHKVATAAATLALLATITAVTPTQLAMHRSCGYHCNEDGSTATPAAPPTIEVQPAGRTNVHSDGRAAGRAMPRVGSPTQRGIGGRAIHKVDYTTHDVVTVELVGRTNIHSGGRLHGSANKRVGCGGCAGHPAGNEIIIGIGNAAGIQLS